MPNNRRMPRECRAHALAVKCHSAVYAIFIAVGRGPGPRYRVAIFNAQIGIDTEKVVVVSRYATRSRENESTFLSVAGKIHQVQPR